ncbi:catalase, partial [Pseudomonas syringae pv. tagetis]
DLEKMPIEDASTIWPEDLSPYVAVARIDVPRQSSWSEQSIQEVDEAMSFSPWHALEAHRPQGGVMRVPKPAYENSSGFRS